MLRRSMESEHFSMQLRSGAIGDRSPPLMLRRVAAALLAFALVAALIATVLLAMSFPRTARLPPTLIFPSDGFSFVVSRNAMRDLLTPSILSDLYESNSDDIGQPNRSELVIREDGRELGPAHRLHDKIRSDGGGAYSHWEGGL